MKSNSTTNKTPTRNKRPIRIGKLFKILFEKQK